MKHLLRHLYGVDAPGCTSFTEGWVTRFRSTGGRLQSWFLFQPRRLW